MPVWPIPLIARQTNTVRHRVVEPNKWRVRTWNGGRKKRLTGLLISAHFIKAWQINNLCSSSASSSVGSTSSSASASSSTSLPSTLGTDEVVGSPLAFACMFLNRSIHSKCQLMSVASTVPTRSLRIPSGDGEEVDADDFGAEVEVGDVGAEAKSEGAEETLVVEADSSKCSIP